MLGPLVGFVFLLLIPSSSYVFPSGSESLWSFAIIADPHIQGSLDHKTKLENCVEWINRNAKNKLIKMVFVLGDIAWGKDGKHVLEAKEILDRLAVPYIPLIGDNDIGGDPYGELHFAGIFEPQYILLSTLLQNWQKASVHVWNPELERNSYFQNFSFDYNGVHFVAPDLSSRIAEDTELHNFSGGTWSWFVDDIAKCQKNREESIVIISHPPMCNYFGLARYSMTPSEFNLLKDFTVKYADYIYANFSGHFHLNGVVDVKNSAGYKVYLTDATFDDKNSIRVVYVLSFLKRVYYFHSIYEPNQTGPNYRHTQKTERLNSPRPF